MAPVRREQIVRATIRCLARDGYAGLTMRRLAAVNRRAYARARRLIGAGLAQGVSACEFRRTNVEEAAVVVLAVLDGLSLQLTFDRGLMTLPRAARAAETV